MKRFALNLLILSFLAGCASHSIQNHEKENAPSLSTADIHSTIPVDPKIKTGTLPNGLRYYIRENKKPENRAELRLGVNAGSVLEDDDQQGLAHFTEHMAFNGTEHFSKHEIVDYLESIGMTFGPEINAYTGFDETVYMLEIPTDSAEVMDKAFFILSEWAQHVSMETEEIDKERGIIIEEWRLGRGASARMRDKQFPVLFSGSQYAKRLPIGEKAVLDTFAYASLRRFYKDWYRPDLMAVSAAGDFDADTIEQLIQKYFSPLINPPDEKPRKFFDVPDHPDTKFAIAADPEATGNVISIYYKKPLKSEKLIVDYRRMLMENCYDMMMNQRLYERTLEADPPYLGAVAGSDQLVRTKGLYYVAAQVRDNGLPAGLEALLTELERVKRFGFTATELDRVKQEMQRGIERAVKEKDKTPSASYAEEYLRNFFEDEPIPGIENEYLLYDRFLPGISLEEINALAAHTISDSSRVILVNMPEREDLPAPTEDELLSVFNFVQHQELTPYEDAPLDEPLVSEPPVPGTIVREIFYDSTGVTEWTLSNGVRAALKPTDFKNDEIRFDSFSPGGYSLAPDSLYIAALTATSLIEESGLGPFNQIALQKKLAGKMVSVSPEIGNLTEGISGSASPDDVETMFQLIYLYFTEPRTDSTAFISYKTRMKGYIENRSVRPETAFGDTLRVTLSQHHFRSRPWQPGLLDEMDLDDSRAFYEDRFKDAGDFTFFFVGNFTLDAIKPFVLTYLGGLPSTGRKETWKDPGILPPEGVVKKEVRKGIEPKSRVSLVFTGPYEYQRLNNYLFNSMIEVMDIKLREVIREDLSGTYGVSVDGTTSQFPQERYSVSVSFGCSPDRVGELVDSIFVQIDSLASFGPKSALIQKVRESQIRHYEVNLKENGFWLNNLYHVYYSGRSPESILTYPKLMDSLNEAAIQEAVKKYFRKDHYVEVVLVPEKQAVSGER